MKLLLIGLLLSPLLITAQRLSGKVISVDDGNTFEVGVGEEIYRVVLLGVDSPEITQAGGVEAKKFLEKFLLGHEVLLHIHGKNRHKDYIGIVLLKDSVDIRVPLLEHGLAWTAETDPIQELEQIRAESARKRRGLWQEQSPVPPWIYRRQLSMSRPKGR